MAKIPALTARQVIRALKKAGFVEDRQKGSHLILINSSINARTVVPVHPGKTIKKPLLLGIISDTKLTREEFLALL